MRLPNFLCIGAQKSGTTLLAGILKQHRDIFIPDIKEPHFFNLDENFSKGMQWYHSMYYQGADNAEVVGDFTPAYLFFDYVPARIFNTLGPQVKFVIMLRNPIDRAYSHYWMSFRRGYETLPFEKAIAMEHARIRKGYFEKSNFSYISRGFYSEQIKRYLNFFSRKNMHFILFEEFVKDIDAGIKQNLLFLGCKEKTDFSLFEDKVNSGDMSVTDYLAALRTNRSHIFSRSSIKLTKTALTGGKMSYPPLQPGVRALLSELYSDEIKALEGLIGKDLSLWYSEGCNNKQRLGTQSS